MKIDRNILNVLQLQCYTQPVTWIYVNLYLTYIFHFYNLRLILEGFETAIVVHQAVAALSLEVVYFMATHW